MSAVITIGTAVISAILTGLFSFGITRYTYTKNIPLDKLEITYNRVYYPISILIENCKEMEEVLEKAKLYLVKYNKYVDRITLKLYKYISMQDPDDSYGKKQAYREFVNNINNRCEYLRKRLGYLEPSFLQWYKEVPKPIKTTIRSLLETGFIYIIVPFIPYIPVNAAITFTLILIMVCTVIIVEIIIRLIVRSVRNVIWIVRKLVSKYRAKHRSDS